MEKDELKMMILKGIISEIGYVSQVMFKGCHIIRLLFSASNCLKCHQAQTRSQCRILVSVAAIPHYNV